MPALTETIGRTTKSCWPNWHPSRTIDVQPTTFASPFSSDPSGEVMAKLHGGSMSWGHHRMRHAEAAVLVMILFSSYQSFTKHSVN